MNSKASRSHSYPYQIAEGQIQKAIYFSPRAVFSFFEEVFQIEPLLLLAANLEDKKLIYEFDLQAKYQWDKNLFFSLTGGALYKEKEIYLSLLAKTAASF